MSRRAMQMSNKKAAAQRRTAFEMSKAVDKEREKQARGLFSYRSSADPSAFKPLTADSGYVRDTIEYPSNNAIGGSTGPSQRFELDTANIIVGQAYNKGNLVVLTRDESDDPRTGKRR